MIFYDNKYNKKHKYIFSICDYIIDLYTINGYTIQGIKLMDLFYYLQIESLRRNKRALFKEDIIAYGFHPSCECLLNKYCLKGLSYLNIYYPYVTSLNDFIYKWYIKDSIISKDDRDLINDVCYYLKDFSIPDLVTLCYKDEIYLKHLRNDNGKEINKIITIEEIQKAINDNKIKFNME